ncbi:hypothetical protein B0J11DRAFT_178122 [Dendryphion nanum]|uniref:Uncharacterized protein n=1 Tax=Dendryphion nanum TaxID=256645 RepID=A0A9P9EDW2_9PLEO|nr:hypothetical protein B0J11DRAFT_178122 [Dendryphion nanum]
MGEAGVFVRLAAKVAVVGCGRGWCNGRGLRANVARQAAGLGRHNRDGRLVSLRLAGLTGSIRFTVGGTVLCLLGRLPPGARCRFVDDVQRRSCGRGEVWWAGATRRGEGEGGREGGREGKHGAQTRTREGKSKACTRIHQRLYTRTLAEAEAGTVLCKGHTDTRRGGYSIHARTEWRGRGERGEGRGKRQQQPQRKKKKKGSSDGVQRERERNWLEANWTGDRRASPGVPGLLNPPPVCCRCVWPPPPSSANEEPGWAVVPRARQGKAGQGRQTPPASSFRVPVNRIRFPSTSVLKRPQVSMLCSSLS